ncbi:MAG: hypothetical protein E6G20_12440, partial [Actinobacteria bacterium]
MSITRAPDRFTTLPDDDTLAATVVALEEHGFSVEVVADLDAAREAVLARIPDGSTVMTNTSVTLQETGIAAAIDSGGPYESARNKMLALDFATQLPEMKAIAGQPEYALGSVHAVSRDGTLVIASASGSQLASYAWGAANVIFVAGAQIEPTPPTGRTAASERFSRSTRRTPAASMSSSSDRQSDFERRGERHLHERTGFRGPTGDRPRALPVRDPAHSPRGDPPRSGRRGAARGGCRRRASCSRSPRGARGAQEQRQALAVPGELPPLLQLRAYAPPRRRHGL